MNRQTLFRRGFLATTLTALAALTAVTMAQSPPSTPIDSAAQAMCPDAHLWGSGLVTNICWSCLFPMKIMGAVQMGSGSVPENASNQSVCFCNGNGGVPELGFVLGMWAPSALIELVRKPYCSPSLGGTQIRKSFRLWGTVDGPDGGPTSGQFLNYHYFSFPLYAILDFLISPDCNAGGFLDFDLLYLSEIDPTWAEDELSIFTSPEVAVAANPILQASCPVDCAAATFTHPIDRMWWCSGCWGSLYPFVGNVPSGGSPPRVSSLLATRALAALHRRGLAWRTMGNDALCGGKIFPMLPKQQYRMSMLFPVPEASNAIRTLPPSTAEGTGNPTLDDYNWTQGCCHNIGVPTFAWGEWRNIPAVGEDFVYLNWRWTDCCVR
jgi:conjugal transfer pilus assembly protein TraU